MSKEVEFSTINIIGFVLAYLLLFPVAYLVNLFIEFDPVYIYSFIFLIAPIYMLFSGKLHLELCEDHLFIKWLKRPLFGKQPDYRIHYGKILRWKYRRGGRGPDSLIFILKSGKKIRIRPSIFNMKELETDFVKSFGMRISEFHSNHSTQELMKELAQSAYVQKLKKEKTILNYLLILNTGIAVLFLAVGSFSEGNSADEIWILFCLSILVFLLLSFRFHYLKNELKETLSLN